MRAESRKLIAGDTEARTLGEAVFNRLRDDILCCRLMPGAKLLLDELRLRYGAGGSAVREALQRLTSSGLVTAEGQRGFRVAEISVDDLIDLTRIRIWVEITAIRSALACGGRDWEADVVAAAYRLGPVQPRWRDEDPEQLDEDWVVVHRRFHDVLVAACNSKQFLSYRKSLQDMSDRYRRYSAKFRQSRDLAAQHQALADAVIARDANKAAMLIAEHFIETAEAVIAHLSGSADRLDALMAGLRQDMKAGFGA